ncbi:lytic murein transglycosylase [Shewanella intestini]|uniref:Lytic murein transglycosylase n=1 Tax=Shewanella intestini TaxID=2017544 RepID=A0ABS5HZ49_9GAMM|nr:MULTISPECIES: lytic murein transglycosylase [Shewanella]MBR9727063.1 lytic murein transglycosylase [Shewanella intestini]MRG35865.1 lytic murein transglycosylase [Shewanella sp. XMDDZSB0408]
MAKIRPLSALLSCVVFSSVCASFPTFANPAEFNQCVVQLKQQAKQAGISQQTIDTSVANLKYVPRVIELDRGQPEFTTTFADYLGKRVTESRVNQGRKLLKKHHDLLQQLTKKYGVPGQYIVAFWGLETNFGGYKGKMPILNSLATLACDPRRSKYFTQELMQALKLKEKYHFSDEKMVGSWAGAMGHTQFMPTNYAKYAVDGDGDGIADLWNSTTDALTSAANFLQHLGWKPNERWGREVLLPKPFDFELLGAKHAQPLTDWAKLNITQVSGQRLSTPDMKAALYVPSGHKGPAFLGYDNFNVIMRWNRSTFYAIAVGHLADRINGGVPLAITPPLHQRLSRAQVKQLQQALNDNGFEVGKPDGVLGKNSINGVQAYQRSKGLVADGFPDKATFSALGLAHQ